MDRSAQNGGHFLALDSLRGICALAVVLFHFRTTGTLSNLAFVRHSWMFVDFFFVLSGFVIAAAYGRRLAEGDVSIRRFMWLRMGRIYPLHIAVIAAMVVLEILGSTVLSQFAGREAFSGRVSVTALFQNIFLLNSFGVSDHLTWNGPSWSIAAEMWMYLLFALVFACCGRARWAVLWGLGMAAALGFLVAAPNALNATYDYGFIRCVYGFSLGTLVFCLFQRGFTLGGTLAEAVVVGITILFVSLVGSGKLTVLAPIVFALPILVLAKGEGAIARLMTTRILAWLGTISYSVYMIHGFVEGRIADIIQLGGGSLGLSILHKKGMSEFPTEIISGSPVMLDLLVVLTALIVIGLGSLSYLIIEKPCRDWSRRVDVGRRVARDVRNPAVTDDPAALP
jgi:peptidoglycan/LPS O-acetylase OafA/YrhL